MVPFRTHDGIGRMERQDRQYSEYSEIPYDCRHYKTPDGE